RLAPAETRAVVGADARCPLDGCLHPSPRGRHRSLRRFEDDGRRTAAAAIDVELMIADVEEPPRVRELAALDRGRDAFGGGADEHEEEQHDARDGHGAANGYGHQRLSA